MNLLSQKWLLNRRHVLRGLGVSIALPMLNCMRPLYANPAEQASKPKRAVFIYLPNGVNTLDYQITKAGKDYEFSKITKPLEKHRQNITPISGLYHPNGIGHHHNCQDIWLTGAKIGPTERNTISVDQMIAAVTAPQTRFPSLQLSCTGRSLSWTSDGIVLPSEKKPSEVFKRLFEGPKDGIGKQRRALQRHASVLDAVLEEARSLKNQIGSEDRSRLDQYLTSVREVETRVERADAWLDVARPEVDAETRAKVTQDVSNTRPGEYYRTMYDLMVLTLRTDMTRVITFMSGDESHGLAIPEIGVSQTRHELSHHNGDPEQLRRLTQSDTYNIEQFSYFLDELTSVEEEAGSLLDNTMVLYGSGMAYGHSHGNANLPLVLAGGKSFGLRHGRHVDYNQGHFDGYDLSNVQQHYRLCSRPVNSKAHLSNLLLTIAQKMDVPTEQFADSNSSLSEVQA